MADITDEGSQKKVLRSGGIILASQEAALEQLAADLEKRISPTFILVADTAGQSILSRGDLDKKKLTALGSLVAGDLAASQEMARVIGEYGNYQMILREGKDSNFFISEVGEELLLLCQVPNRTPLGWSRLLVRETAKQAAEILKTPGEEMDKMDFGLDDEKLADLFGDSLSNIWNH